jgi:hypothetical protein
MESDGSTKSEMSTGMITTENISSGQKIYRMVINPFNCIFCLRIGSWIHKLYFISESTNEMQLTISSYLILVFTGLGGLLGTIAFWRYADNNLNILPKKPTFLLLKRYKIC